MQFNELVNGSTAHQMSIQQDSNFLIDTEAVIIETTQRNFRVILEDAGHSGYHRPHWKFHVWLENDEGFSFLNQSRILYAVIFYDGEAEIKLKFDHSGHLHIEAGYDVKDILYPWAVGTIGRGNPYHKIKGTEIEGNGIKYFDYDGFVGYPYNKFSGDQCNSFDNKYPYNPHR